MNLVGRFVSPAVAAGNRTVARAPSLAQAVGDLGKDVVRLRGELQRAQLEINRLRGQLARTQPSSAMTSPAQKERIQRLRRQISFHCHPDRGGDGELMQRINELFDDLETLSPGATR